MYCDQCGQWFLHDKDRKKHVKTVHENLGDKPTHYKCDICPDDEIFDSTRGYLQHYRVVHNDLPPEYKHCQKVYCELCGNWFMNEKARRIHVFKFHENRYMRKKQTYTCPHCKKNYTKKTQLKEHVMSVHENNTPYACDICPRKFALRLSLKSHKSTVHGNAKCDICQRVLSNQTDLGRHQLKVHGVVPKGTMNCQHCPLVFKIKSQLENHILNKHSDLTM